MNYYYLFRHVDRKLIFFSQTGIGKLCCVLQTSFRAKLGVLRQARWEGPIGAQGAPRSGSLLRDCWVLQGSLGSLNSALRGGFYSIGRRSIPKSLNQVEPYACDFLYVNAVDYQKLYMFHPHPIPALIRNYS